MLMYSSTLRFMSDFPCSVSLYSVASVASAFVCLSVIRRIGETEKNSLVWLYQAEGK